jgi:integrase
MSLPFSPPRLPVTTSTRRHHRRARVPLDEPLKHLQLSSPTRQRYQSAFSAFLDWCDSRRIRVSNDQQLDDVLTSYFTTLFHAGESVSRATYALYGLYNEKPRLRGRLKESEAALKGWKKVEPVHRRPPMNFEVAVAIALWMASHNYLNAAVATLVGFNGYLRVSELCALKVTHVKWPRDARVGSAYDGVAVYLPKSKTGDFQSVKIRHAGIAKLLCQWISSRDTEQFVFGLTPSAYRAILSQACVALKIDHVGYTPHSLRHGGATCDFMAGVPLEDILLIGRWESSKSARTYVKQGLGLMLAATLPSRVMELGLKYSADIYSALQCFLPTASPIGTHL